MKKVLLFALVLSSVHIVRADEAPQEQDNYETLTKVAAAVIAIGAISTALYATKGDVMGALRSVRVGGLDLPKPGFSKKALALAGIAGLGTGLLAAGAVGLMVVVKFVTMPTHVQLDACAHVAQRYGRPDHENLLMGMSSSFQEMAKMGGEKGDLAHFVLNHLNFMYMPFPRDGIDTQPPPVQRLLKDKS